MTITAPRAGVLAAVACVVVLSGCSNGSDGSDGSDDSGTAGPAAETPTGAPATTATPSSSAPSPTPVPPTSASSSVPAPTEPPKSTEPIKPTKASAPTATPTASLALVSVRNDVESIAPQLESYYRNREYPEDLAQVRQTLAESGVTLRPGNTVAGYVYDGDDVEFTLCIENTSGAWATYDTAPMTLRQSGETGGCP